VVRVNQQEYARSGRKVKGGSMGYVTSYNGFHRQVDVEVKGN